MSEQERLGFTVTIPQAVMSDALAAGQDLEVLVRRWETGAVQADTRHAAGRRSIWEPVELYGAGPGAEVYQQTPRTRRRTRWMSRNVSGSR